MDLAAQLRAALLAQALPAPSAAFLSALVAARSPPPPLASLVATARARLLACDLVASALVDAAALAALPAPALAPAPAAAPRDVRLPRDVHVQVLDVENLAASRWQQVEELEAVARGERTRGRRVVRVAADADDDAAPGPGPGPGPGAGAGATHRLVLQDHRGHRVYALELRRVDAIAAGKTAIGEKMVLRAGTVVSRGHVLLTPETCTVLGGKVDAWHDAWTRGRLARLNEAVRGGPPP